MSVPVIGPAGHRGSHLTRVPINWIAFIHKKGNAICLLAVIFVILTIALRSIQEAYFTLPSFDGAMNLQVPVTLIKYGRYATGYNSIIDFDQGIQSGAPLLFPIYLMFLVFGKSSCTAQLVSSMYLILTAVVIYHLTAINTNRVFALLGMVFFMLTPSLLKWGHHIYGEIPALFYLLSSLVILYRLENNPDGPGIILPLLTGILYGLSYLTKTVMLIAAPSIILIFMIDLLFVHKLKVKHYILMLIGFTLPIVAFECYKLIQLGAAAYPGWWNKQFYAIMTHAGVEKKYGDAANLYVKMLVNRRNFCKYFLMNTFTMLCFLCIPHLIFLINFLYHFIKKRRDHINLTLAIVYGTAMSYMLWWIFITPTARAWPRRIIDGYILQEIAFVISLYFLWKFLSTTNYKVHFSKKIIGGIVFTVMLLVILFQGVVNVKRVGFLFEPSQEKLNAERVVKTIELLPQKAKIFGFGWWQAPILSFLSNRMFLDMALHGLPKYPVKLRDTYFVIDYPDALEHVSFSVLTKTKNRLIERQGHNYLYQIEYISDYSYTNSNRENRSNAIAWLAKKVMPSDKVVIAKELGIDEDEQRLLKLKMIYVFARSDVFKKIRKDDLINVDDGHILRRLQRSPEFVYEKPALVSNFFEINKFKIRWPKIITKEGSEITEEWVADNSVTYVVGYDNIVVDDNAPFYDPLFRKSLKRFPLAHIKPKKIFSGQKLRRWFLNKEPKVKVYKFY